MYSIIVADDDQQIREMLKECLHEAGYDVRTAENGKVAMQHQNERPADLVVTDLVMPEQEGMETLKMLRQDYPGTRLVVISGGGRNAPAIYLRTAQMLGADAVFEKPFDRHALLDEVARLLGTAKAESPVD